MEACLSKDHIVYSLNNKKKDQIKLLLNKGVFKPTETSKYLLEAVVKNFPKKKVNVLDLGCGNGILGIYLLKKFKNIINMTFADISTKAIKNAKENCMLNKIPENKIRLLKSNVFSNLDSNKFDVIINDVSGISSKVAKLSDWFVNVPCESGEDGVKLTLDFLIKFNLYLKPNGYVFFPIISLCNEKKVFNFFRRKKIINKIISTNDWPIPKNMYKHILTLKKLKKNKKINYEEKYGLFIANTKIFQIKI